MSACVGLQMITKDDERWLLQPQNGKCCPITVSTVAVILFETTAVTGVVNSYPSVPLTACSILAAVGGLLLYGYTLYKQITFNPNYTAIP